MLPSQNYTTKHHSTIQRLTALWALSESGLGGMMFALKIPLTGFFVGGFAVIMLGLIAYLSNNSYKQIIQSTIIVLIVKAAVSPHSPPPAYLAVAFQGFIAALLFSKISSHKVAAILLGMISMAESAIQKILVLTVIFGKKLWEAIDALFAQISKEFSITVHKDYSVWLIGTYVILYIIWGAIVGKWSSGIPKYINQQKADILKSYLEMHAEELALKLQVRQNKKIKKIIGFVAILVFIISIFLLTGSGSKTVLFILARSIAALLLIYYVLKPVTLLLLKKWLSKRSGAQQKAAEEIISLLPHMKSYAGAAFTMAGNETNYLKRLRKFILCLITLSLYVEQPQKHYYFKQTSTLR